MSDPQWRSQAAPAQLSFLAIYNPSLGPTDDTFRDQLVFFYSRTAHEARASAKKAGRSDALSDDEARAQENEHLRQIGLAQGMVDFANTFSNAQPVDAVETEKSRIVLQELEPGWWILASIDLTRIPSLPARSSEVKSRTKVDQESEPAIEYSSREVSPSQLLLAQLQQAHHIFRLHHGPSLDDLFTRLSRDRFCNALDRFWTRYARHWDVLLHGNPAIDVFGGLKLASGGELGFGVGEEEWGSGEREVLEDLTRRTEGLVDMVAARFGEPIDSATKHRSVPAQEPLRRWLGNSEQPLATDGIIFGGIGSITRSSLRSISLWLRHIYAYGDHAYGVRDNPLRERRKRKRRKPANPSVDTEEADAAFNESSATELPTKQLRQKVQQQEAIKQNSSVGHPFLELMPKDERPQIHPRVASQDYAVTPEETPTPPLDSPQTQIPPPIVSAAEQALQKATDGLDNGSGPAKSKSEIAQSSSTMGIPDHYMKYLTFGLSTLGKTSQSRSPPSEIPSASTGSSKGAPNASVVAGSSGQRNAVAAPGPRDASVSQVNALPEYDEAMLKMAMQTTRENKGHFLIGLQGDLEVDSEGKDAGLTDDSLQSESDGSRTVLRTVHIEVVPRKTASKSSDNDDSTSDQVDASDYEAFKAPGGGFRRLRVVLYLRRPFMYCFLFEDRTSSLQYANFYKTLHHALDAIHKPLLSSTSPLRIAERVEASHRLFSDVDASDKPSTTNNLPPKGNSNSPIFDLIYDPRLLTLHASIPNIPAPGTLAAEGLPAFDGADGETTPSWTRTDALNVHGQIIDTLASVKNQPGELERTSKTNRGWWVVWMRIARSLQTGETGENEAAGADDYDSNATLRGNDPTTRVGPRQNESENLHRTAFLVRRQSVSSSVSRSSGSSSRAVSGIFSAMTLGLAGRSTEDNTGGASAGWGPGALAGGIGVDARKYVEGLLSLSR